jgi:hypothetical protein
MLQQTFLFYIVFPARLFRYLHLDKTQEHRFTVPRQARTRPKRPPNKGQEEMEPGTGPIRTSRTPKHRVNKLVPPRPFPTRPTSVSATGPRSAHQEGKNYITVTRKTKLGSYLRRCKDVILKNGCVHSRVGKGRRTDIPFS